MSDQQIPPTSEEIEATRRHARAFIEAMAEVPDGDRVEVRSDKFAGPVGDPRSAADLPDRSGERP